MKLPARLALAGTRRRLLPLRGSGAAGRLTKMFTRIPFLTCCGSILSLAVAFPLSAAGTGEHAFLVPGGASGFYRVTSAAVTLPGDAGGSVDLRVAVQRGGRSTAEAVPVLRTILAPGTHYEFDPFLGYLDEGDRVVCQEAGVGGARVALPGLRWQVERMPGIPVLALGSADGKPAAALEMKIPHSGFYALDGATAQFAGAMVTRSLGVAVSCGGRELKDCVATAGRARLSGELGYLRKGESLRLEVRAPGNANAPVASFHGMLVEWAPRRAPLRVQRGADGLLDVLEPGAPRVAVDIPGDRWLRVPASAGDATAAIRKALASAGALAKAGGYAGVKLDAGATYLVASGQSGGVIFPLDGLNRVVLDGNGATFDVRATELERRGVTLFLANEVRSVVLADFQTRSEAWSSTFGTILDVSPQKNGNQTVTFRLDDGQASPLALIPTGHTPGYAYDAVVPGRLAAGAWSHYPPAEVRPSLEATADPRVFRHTVTRTNESIPRGEAAGEPGKWLVKQKKAGTLLLTVRSTAEDVTLCGVTSGGATNGVLRLWGGSGVNVLGCRFEPPPGRWISTSSDGFHGRAREAVWLEDVVIAGVCEDVLNLYATTMGIAAADPSGLGSTVTLMDLSLNDAAPGGFRTSPLAAGTVRPGDWLVFCNPADGPMLGRVRALAVTENGTCTLSAPVAGLQPWDPARGRSNIVAYNESAVAGMVMRDCEIRDSLRFGAFLKARDCVVFHNTFAGLTGPAIQGANEPGWPEGPFAQNLWLQDNTFAGNAHGYEPRHRAFLSVDPAAVAIYARKLSGAADPGVLAANDLRLLGNTFSDWRGMALAVRNARSVQIVGNQFLAPLADEAMRRTLASDPLLTKSGSGRFAAVLVDGCSGVRLAGNRCVDLPAGDLPAVIGAGVIGLEQSP